MTDCYYKVRQVLQSVTGSYYKVRQVLQSATVTLFQIWIFFIRLSLILSQLELSRIELPKLGSYRSTKLIHFLKKHTACIGLQTERIFSVNI